MKEEERQIDSTTRSGRGREKQEGNRRTEIERESVSNAEIQSYRFSFTPAQSKIARV